MLYNADALKKQYEKECLEQRNKNLKKLREDIAKMSSTKFANQIGIKKPNLSRLESGDANLSLSNIHAYKTYFKDNFSLNVSVDFLMGYTDVIENQSMSVAKDLGLSAPAIAVLKGLSTESRDTLNKLTAEDGLFDLLLTELWLYANNSTYTNISIKNLITESVNDIKDEKEVDAMMRFKAIDTFNMILYFIKKSFSPFILQAAENKIRLSEKEKEIARIEDQLKKLYPDQKGVD